MPERSICYLITELDPGGAEKALFELATRLDRERYAVSVGSLTDEGEVAGRLRDAGVDVFSIGMRHTLCPFAALRLRRELRKRRPQLLHCFLFHANLAGRLVGRWAGVPLIMNSVRVEEQRASHLRLDRMTRGRVDLEVCVSESTRRYTAQHARMPQDKLAVVPNGIDLARFDDVPDTPTDWGLDAPGPVIAWVGRLDKQKDPFTFLCAAGRVLRRFPDATFAMAGDGPLREEVEARIEEMGLGERVTLLGRIDDVRPLLKRSSLLALSSVWEGMPNVVLEAMASARPVVSTAVGGAPELVEEGETGFLAPPRHACALADGMARLLGDPDRASAMGRAGRERVEHSFTIDRTVAAWEALYDRLFDRL